MNHNYAYNDNLLIETQALERVQAQQIEHLVNNKKSTRSVIKYS
jgi:hypothetical protein